MQVKPFLHHILDDEGLTRGLRDPEARILIEWLVEHTECIAENAGSDAAAWGAVKRLCNRGRAIGRFVGLWCHLNERGAAVQLAATERFNWPLPNTNLDPCELMYDILQFETRQAAA